METKGKEVGMSPRSGAKSTLIAVDTGGTFTDLLALHRGDGAPVIRRLKLPSTPDDPAAAVLEGIGRLVRPGVPFDLVHGSTVATNAILERKGARVVLVTNRGFEDVVEIGRQDRPQLYALAGYRPPPLVGREDRLGITGRLDEQGGEVAPLDAEELAALPDRIPPGAHSLAVTLLHAYANPDHEEQVAEALAGMGLPLSISSRILPEFREYERTSTTVVNAYVAPRMQGYLRRLEGESGAEALRIMGSGGGSLPLERAVREPVHTVLSGPAGGVMGALTRGLGAGFSHLLTLDMGGTSTDVALVPGHPLHTREGEVGGVPVAIPILDIHTVGAGGGSIARVDPGGALRVGPESAGADPGPICYARGGAEVTVTDANLWLGRLRPEGFLGGRGTLDREAVTSPLRALADEAGLSPDEAAEGVVEVVNTAMERALRVISVQRGVDPAGFHLMAFGGAAGLHAVELAERLGVKGVLIPPDPGLLSAFGMLVAPVVRDRARTLHLPGSHPEVDLFLTRVLEELEREGREEMVLEGADPETLASLREVDARYRGQSHELRVGAEGWREAFHALHRERYGYAREEAEVELVTARVRVEAPGADLPAEVRTETEGRDAHDPSPLEDQVPVRSGGETLLAGQVKRDSLAPGNTLRGPLLVLEYSSTTWCPPGWVLTVVEGGVLHIRRE